MSTPSRDYHLVLWLGQRPLFCCCCWCLSRDDARRAKRVFRLVRAVMTDWHREPIAAPEPPAPSVAPPSSPASPP